MIHGLYANQPSFQSVEFTSGLNIVLAERTATSTRKDTRNGLGKSTLIELIDFCLGANVQTGYGLCIEPLKDWAFTLDITVAGNRVKVTRSIKSPKHFIIDGPTSGWIEQPDLDKESGQYLFSPDRWKTLLGWGFFGLPRSNDAHKHKPSYRSLVSYFVRRGLDAYDDPFRFARQQQPGNIQLNIGYLLGLNWEYASKWQELKDQEKGIKAINDAIKSGVMQGVVGSVGELEAQRVQLEEQIKHEREALDTFKVHPQYETVQLEADRVTAQIHELTNQNISDRRRLSRYKQSVSEEKSPSTAVVEKLYEEMGFVFPDAVRRTLVEAKEFHLQIVKNRKVFLETEIKRLERQMLLRSEQTKQLTDSRAVSMEVLRTHGALQEMTKLQEKHLEVKSRLESIKTRILEVKGLTSQKRDIRVAKVELTMIAEQDHEQRREVWADAIRLFNENSQALYSTPGRLVIDIAETGYKYDVEIQRSDSEGIGKMKVFCFDLMLLQFSAVQKRGMDFLIHDSALFDGVDSRQRAIALERACQVSKELGAQYICTLNSDEIPRDDFSEGFDFNQYIRLTLTDKDQSGSLLGIQFEKPRRTNDEIDAGEAGIS